MMRPHAWPALSRLACLGQQLRAHLVQQLRALVLRRVVDHYEFPMACLPLVTSVRHRSGQPIFDFERAMSMLKQH